MSSPLFKLIAILLLAVQGFGALRPVRVLCVRVQDCGQHAQESDALCGGGDGGFGTVGCGDCEPGPHEHCSGDVTMDAHGECGCYVHLPVGTDPAPSVPKVDVSEHRSLFVPLIVAYVVAWDDDGSAVTPAWPPLADFGSCDQARGLKATRLLI